MTQSASGQICSGIAGPRSQFIADHSIFAAKALGSLDAQVVQSLQIMLIDSRDGGAFFCCLNERGEDLSNSDC